MPTFVCSLCRKTVCFENDKMHKSEDWFNDNGWIKKDGITFCSNIHASIQPCPECPYITAALESLELHREVDDYTIHCNICSDVMSIVCASEEEAIDAWNNGLWQEDYATYVDMRTELIEKVKIMEGIDVTEDVENKQDFLEASIVQKGKKNPFWNSKRVCAKCQEVINVNEYKIVVYQDEKEEDITLIHCPNYPKCKGTDLNWIPR